MSKNDDTPFQVICAWCGRVEPRSKDSKEPAEDAPVSHTICAACFAREQAQVERVIRAHRRRNRPA